VNKRFALSVALTASMTMVGGSAALAQDEAEAEDTGMPPGLPTMADFGAVDRQVDVEGRSLEEWAHDMMLWANGSKDHDVISTGDCTVGQDGPVFFLQNTWLGEVMVLDCTIPADTYILALPGGGFGFNTEDTDTVEGLDDMGLLMGQWFSDPEIIVDGRQIPVGPSSWIHREPFEWTTPENNVWDFPAGYETFAGYGGWFVMLEPLEPGEHTIILADDSSGPAFVRDDEVIYSTGTAYAVYNITVPGAEGDTAEDAAAEDEATDDGSADAEAEDAEATE
jgi:hypothetical protein